MTTKLGGGGGGGGGGGQNTCVIDFTSLPGNWRISVLLLLGVNFDSSMDE